jgi:hypothetical protein
MANERSPQSLRLPAGENPLSLVDRDSIIAQKKLMGDRHMRSAAVFVAKVHR